MKTFKPMLAGRVEHVGQVSFPCLGSPKLDGVRAVVHNGVVYSRNLKPIPNKHVQNLFGRDWAESLDGELVVGLPTAPDCYRSTMSGVMTAAGEPDVTFWVFDNVATPTLTFLDRFQMAVRAITGRVCVQHVHHELLNSAANLDAFEAKCLAAGYEGVMLRSTDGEYKFGRSTLIEGGLLKVKRFLDAEAEIVGFEELMHNGNEATTDELGRTKRSSHKANKSGRGVLGALVCRTPDGVMFNIGTGFDDFTRAELWARRMSIPGQLVKYRYFPSGNKQAPRFPVFLGLRDRRDA